MPFQRILYTGHRACLLPDGHINADDILSLLIQNGVHCNGGLAGLTVTDDQLTLASADGNHGINGQDARLKRLVDRFPCDDAAGLMLDGPCLGCCNGSQTINGLAQHIDHTADEFVSHRHISRTARTLYHSALANARLRPQKHHAHTVLGQIHHHSLNPCVELHQFAIDCLVQSVNCSDPIAHL